VNRSGTFHKPVDVAAAIVQQPDGRVLLAERPSGKPWSGYWEFPGGKIEAGEQPRAALARELLEELGIDVDAVTPWITFVYDYPEKSVRLYFFRVWRWHGEPHGREGQHLAWERPEAVQVAPLLPANAGVLWALNLPPVYAITQASQYGPAEFLSRLDVQLERGLRLIQVREPGMDTGSLRQFADEVVQRAHRHGARVLINADVALARAVGADGVHLPARVYLAEQPLPEDLFWAASCHDASELARAVERGARFAVLSPVLPTASHPGAPVLGWEQFAALVRDCPIPVYALGGMKRELLDTARHHGAHGIALLSGVW